MTVTDNTGSVEKSGLLAAAMQRVNKEAARRRATDAKSTLQANAHNALAKKRAAAEPEEDRPKSRTAGKGMRAIPIEGEPVSGALEKEGQRPVLERSRKVR